MASTSYTVQQSQNRCQGCTGYDLTFETFQLTSKPATLTLLVGNRNKQTENNLKIPNATLVYCFFSTTTNSQIFCCDNNLCKLSTNIKQRGTYFLVPAERNSKKLRDFVGSLGIQKKAGKSSQNSRLTYDRHLK